ncbi:uncharacterized protein SAPINGB_P000405 [Magnusiomyces paraingens]|uniref:Uncharacterized protein n=1 Tax=Magnusiomyces paraingens TaxID=2606893 RepID=A0A5E8B0E0_9ASCO|nr:uncharacterized protein SAPINGB_P000405 [Saprochaete ingens]VVT44405.1 unnamed protein product [Saprochaete ingens]
MHDLQINFKLDICSSINNFLFHIVYKPTLSLILKLPQSTLATWIKEIKKKDDQINSNEGNPQSNASNISTHSTTNPTSSSEPLATSHFESLESSNNLTDSNAHPTSSSEPLATSHFESLESSNSLTDSNAHPTSHSNDTESIPSEEITDITSDEISENITDYLSSKSNLNEQEVNVYIYTYLFEADELKLYFLIPSNNWSLQKFIGITFKLLSSFLYFCEMLGPNLVEDQNVLSKVSKTVLSAFIESFPQMNQLDKCKSQFDDIIKRNLDLLKLFVGDHGDILTNIIIDIIMCIIEQIQCSFDFLFWLEPEDFEYLHNLLGQPND